MPYSLNLLIDDQRGEGRNCGGQCTHVGTGKGGPHIWAELLTGEEEDQHGLRDGGPFGRLPNNFTGLPNFAAGASVEGKEIKLHGDPIAERAPTSLA